MWLSGEGFSLACSRSWFQFKAQQKEKGVLTRVKVFAAKHDTPEFNAQGRKKDPFLQVVLRSPQMYKYTGE